MAESRTTGMPPFTWDEVIASPKFQAKTSEERKKVAEEYAKQFGEAIVRHEAEAIGLNPDLAVATMQQESGGNPFAQSSAGAYGPMQLMQGTAEELKVDRTNYDQNIRGGVRYLKDRIDAFNGNVEEGLAAYNAGENRVQTAKKIHGTEWLKALKPETQNYVPQVLGRLPKGAIAQVAPTPPPFTFGDVMQSPKYKNASPERQREIQGEYFAQFGVNPYSEASQRLTYPPLDKDNPEQFAQGMGGLLGAAPDSLQSGWSQEGKDDRSQVMDILTKNKNKDFVQRILNPGQAPTIQNPDGSVSTHKMAWAEVGDKYVVFPTIQREGNQLKEFGEDALPRALKTGDFIAFNTPEEAEWFSQRYKAAWEKPAPQAMPPLNIREVGQPVEKPAVAPSRSWLGEIPATIAQGLEQFTGAGLKAGRLVGKQFADALPYKHPGAEAIEPTLRRGQLLLEEFVSKNPEWFAQSSESQKSAIRHALTEGGASTIASVLAMIPGFAAGGVYGMAGGAASLFGLAEYQQAEDEINLFNKKNPNNQIPEDIAFKIKLLRGGSEMGFEFASDLIGGKVLGLDKLSKITKDTILNLALTPTVMKTLAKLGKVAAVEVPSEMGTAYTQTAANKLASPQEQGAPDFAAGQPTPLQAAGQAAPAAFVAAMLLAGFGQFTTGLRQRGVLTALAKADAPAEQRMGAVNAVAESIRDKNLRSQWVEAASEAVKQGQPIDIDATVGDTAQQAPAPPPPPPPVQSTPTPPPPPPPGTQETPAGGQQAPPTTLSPQAEAGPEQPTYEEIVALATKENVSYDVALRQLSNQKFGDWLESFTGKRTLGDLSPQELQIASQIIADRRAREATQGATPGTTQGTTPGTPPATQAQDVPEQQSDAQDVPTTPVPTPLAPVQDTTAPVQGTSAPPITPEYIHKLATENEIESDNNERFADFTQEVTKTADQPGKRHLDDMTPEELGKVRDAINAGQRPFKHEYSSTQLNLPEQLASRVKSIAQAIPDADIDPKEGREDQPHVTLKYGLLEDDVAKVQQLLANEPPIKVTFGETSIFPANENRDSDVVKFDVQSPDLERINKKISEALPNVNTYAGYTPHLTVAYVKPGAGEKYAGNTSLAGQEMTLDRVTFSDRMGNQVEIPLTGARTELPQLNTQQEGTPALPAEMFTPRTPNATLQTNVGNDPTAFAIEAPNGALANGRFRDADFPSQPDKPTRGELFFTTAGATQRQGIGTALARDALDFMVAQGTTTVKMSGTTEAGRNLIARLIREQDISEPIQTAPSGTAEYRILRKKGTPNAIQEQGAETLPPQPGAGDSGAVGKGNAPQQEAAGTPQEEEIVPETPPQGTVRTRTVGTTATAATPRGTKVTTQYAIVDAPDLITSHNTNLGINPNYPAELQPRDRTRIASVDQVTRLANGLDPSLLGASAKAGDGAPIIGPDGAVESGNARSIAITKAYQEKLPTATAYKQWLVENAGQFGLDPQQIEQAAAPVLVRVRQGDIDRVAFTQEANEPDVASMGATEKASVDAGRLTSDMLAEFAPDDSGNLTAASNRGFLRRFIGEVVSPSERNDMLTEDGGISQAGIIRVRNAVLAKAYGDPTLIARMAEDPEPNIRTVLNSLTVMAPRFAKIKQGIDDGSLYPLDISPSLAKAANTLSQLRAQNVSVDDHIRQMPMFGGELSQTEKSLLVALDLYSRSGRKLTDALTRYVKLVELAGDPKQASMFGKTTPTIDKVLKAALEITQEEPQNESTGLFEGRRPEGSGPPQEGVLPGPQGPTTATPQADTGRQEPAPATTATTGKVTAPPQTGMPPLDMPGKAAKPETTAPDNVVDRRIVEAVAKNKQTPSSKTRASMRLALGMDTLVDGKKVRNLGDQALAKAYLAHLDKQEVADAAAPPAAPQEETQPQETAPTPTATPQEGKVPVAKQSTDLLAAAKQIADGTTRPRPVAIDQMVAALGVGARFNDQEIRNLSARDVARAYLERFGDQAADVATPETPEDLNKIRDYLRQQARKNVERKRPQFYDYAALAERFKMPYEVARLHIAQAIKRGVIPPESPPRVEYDASREELTENLGAFVAESLGHLDKISEGETKTRYSQQVQEYQDLLRAELTGKSTISSNDFYHKVRNADRLARELEAKTAPDEEMETPTGPEVLPEDEGRINPSMDYAQLVEKLDEFVTEASEALDRMPVGDTRVQYSKELKSARDMLYVAQRTTAPYDDLYKATKEADRIASEITAAAPPAAPTEKEIATFENAEDGTRSVVRHSPDGKFRVTLEDTDAQETVPSVRIFDDQDAAIRYAKSLISPSAPTPAPKPAPGPRKTVVDKPPPGGWTDKDKVPPTPEEPRDPYQRTPILLEAALQDSNLAPEIRQRWAAAKTTGLSDTDLDALLYDTLNQLADIHDPTVSVTPIEKIGVNSFKVKGEPKIAGGPLRTMARKVMEVPTIARPVTPQVPSPAPTPAAATTPTPSVTPAAPQPSGWGTKNTHYTKDAADKARERIRKKLNQVNIGLDPELLQDGITLAGYHIEAGARSFADYTKAMLNDLGEIVRPYLRQWYEGVRWQPGFDAKGMSTAEEIAKFEQSNVAPPQQEEVESPEEDTDDVLSPGEDTEQDSADATTEEPVGEEPIPQERPGQTRGAGSRGGRAGGGQSPGKRDNPLPDASPAPSGERGDQPVYTPDGEPGSEGTTSRDSELAGSPESSGAGKPDERSGTADARNAATATRPRVSDEQKRKAQREAESIPVVAANAANIAETLPFLMPSQHEDVHFAEQRFSKPDGYGVLFANGTGTGKTYLALGAIKRMVRQGKKNGIIVVPSQKIANDWIKSAKNLGLTLNLLEDLNDGGKGIAITTYANFGMNTEMGKRDYDFVAFDEAHTLLQNEANEPTSYLQRLRAITLHPKGAFTRLDLRHPEVIEELKSAQKDAKIARIEFESSPDQFRGQLNKAEERLSVAKKAYDDALRETRQEIEDNQGEKRPRAIFLSATPFAYEKNVEWASGFLFEYPRAEGQGYNSPDSFGAFMMQHFGWRMRTGKLTEPDKNVDRDLMQREFNTWLRKEGVLAARILEVDADYDRKFVLLDDKIGLTIDEGLEWLRETDKGKFRPLYEAIHKKFDFLSRSRLLESLKASAAIPYIKEQHALGRKVVVFYDYNQGGGFDVFDLKEIASNEQQFTINGKKYSWNELVKEYRSRRPDLVALDTVYPSPLESLTKAFPNALIYNGTIPAKKRIADVDAFNDDKNQNANLILVQKAANAGWSGHDATGTNPRVLINLGLPTAPTVAIQQEGRIYRTGQASNAMFRYFNTGTSWERWAFGTTIARRAATAENLAMGEQARGLRDSFIEGFAEAAPDTPGPNDGQGGKAQDRAYVAAISDFDRAKTFYFGQQKKTSKTKAAEGVDYFATPEPLGQKMVEWGKIKTDEALLEPSAGHGAIARWFPHLHKRTAIEPSMELASRLGLVTDADIVNERFEDWHIGNKRDVIVMNPPFGQGGSTAMEHLDLAYKHLSNGGRIVALIPEGPAADKRFDKWLHEEGVDPKKREHPDAYLVGEIHLPNVTFERAGTQIKSRIVIIDKVGNPKDAPTQSLDLDLSDAATIGELFDRIEHIEGPARPQVTETVKPGRIISFNRNTGRYLVKFPYDEELVSAVKQIGGGRWDPISRQWSFAAEKADDLRDFAAQHQFEMADEEAPSARAMSEPAATMPPLDMSDMPAEEDWTLGDEEESDSGKSYSQPTQTQAPTPTAAPIPWVNPNAPNYQPPQTRAQRKALVRRGDIIRQLEKAIKAPQLVGKMRGARKSIQGWYERPAQLIRVRQWGDIPTRGHEIGHFLEDHLFGNDRAGQLAREGFFRKHSKDLMKLAQTQKRPSRKEGWAELMRGYLTDRAATQQKAPALMKELDDLLKAKDPGLHAVFEEVERKVQAAENMTLDEQLESHIVRDPEASRPSMWETLDNAYSRFVNDLHFLRKVSPDVEEEAHSARQWMRGAVRMALFEGTPDFKTHQARRVSLAGALEPVREHTPEFERYGIAKRIIEFGERVANDPNDTRAKNSLDALRVVFRAHDQGAQLVNRAKQLVAQREQQFPEFKKAFADLQEWNSDLLDYMVDSGRLAQENREAIEDLNKSYFPFYRMLMDQQGREYLPGRGEGGAAGGIVNVPPGIRGLKGSSREFASPLEGFVKNAYAMITLAERNAVGRSLAEVADKGGADTSIWIRPIDAPMEKLHVPVEQLRKNLEDAGVDTSHLSDKEFAEVAQLFGRDIYAQKENEVIIYKDGKPYRYEVDPRLKKAITGINRAEGNALTRFLHTVGHEFGPEAEKALDLALTGPGRMLQKGATILNPEFWLLNPFRDVTTRAFYTYKGGNPYPHIAKSLKGFVKGFASAYRGDEWAKAWEREGGLDVLISTFDREGLQYTMKDVLRGTDKAQFQMTRPVRSFLEVLFDKAQAIGQLTEMANRIPVFREALEAQGVTDPAQATREQLSKAAYETQDAVINFPRGGSAAKAVNMTKPFFNANIQGQDKLVRSFVNDKKKFAAYGFAAFTVPAMILWALQHDHETYQNLAQWKKDRFWVIIPDALFPGMGFNPEHYFVLPKPPVLGEIFASLPERLADAWVGQGWDPLQTAGSIVGGAFLPFPTTLVGIFENLSNWDSFRDRYIDAPGEDRKLGAYRGSGGASEMARDFAKLMERATDGGVQVSPNKFDHLLQSWTGGSGRIAQDVYAGTKGLARKSGADVNEPPAKKIQEWPIIRAIAKTNPSSSSEPLSRFYELWKPAEEAHSTYKDVKESGSVEEIREFEERYKEELANYEDFKTDAKTIQRLNREIREDQDARGLDGELKTKRKDRAVREKNRVAERALERQKRQKNPAKMPPLSFTVPDERGISMQE